MNLNKRSTSHSELLVHYIEGTLTNVARREFEQCVAASPELAQEVHELQTIEDILYHQALTIALTIDKTAIPFLEKIENDIAALLRGAGASSSSPTKPVANDSIDFTSF